MSKVRNEDAVAGRRVIEMKVPVAELDEKVYATNRLDVRLTPKQRCGLQRLSLGYHGEDLDDGRLVDTAQRAVQKLLEMIEDAARV